MQHRKSLSTIAVTAAALLALVGCSAPSPTNSSGSAGPGGLAEAGVINQCVALSYEPLEYYENGTSGEIIGWDTDGVRALAALWGITSKVTSVEFDSMIPGLQSGHCDIVWSGIYINKDRAAVADVVPVLRTGSEVILTKNVAKNVTDRLGLCDLRIAAQTGTEDEKHLQEASDECVAAGKPKIQITGYPGSVDAMASILSGKLDGLIDTTTLIATLEKKNDTLKGVPGLFTSNYWFGAYTAKGSELSTAVREGIHKLIENGTLKKLAEKYGLNVDDIAHVDTNPF